jgi:hypothetical protein
MSGNGRNREILKSYFTHVEMLEQSPGMTENY